MLVVSILFTKTTASIRDAETKETHMSNKISNKRAVIAAIKASGLTKNGLPYVTGLVAYRGIKGASNSVQNFSAFGKGATNILTAGKGRLIVIAAATEKESSFIRNSGEAATAMDLTISYAYALPSKVAV